jgi:putative solute:sodium symporter small subunit
VSPSSGPSAEPLDEQISDATRRYWRRNVSVMAVLLAVWAVAGLGCGVLFADELNRLHLGGFPLGFWFAQQGSILVFVALIFLYALILNRLDAEHHRELEAIRRASRRPRGGPSS